MESTMLAVEGVAAVIREAWPRLLPEWSVPLKGLSLHVKNCMLNLYGSARLWFQDRAHCDGWERNTFSVLLVATPKQCFTNSVLTWQGSITVRSVSLSFWSCWGREVP